MTIYETADKRAHLPLLFLADESERMIARYLDRGTNVHPFSASSFLTFFSYSAIRLPGIPCART